MEETLFMWFRRDWSQFCVVLSIKWWYKSYTIHGFYIKKHLLKHYYRAANFIINSYVDYFHKPNWTSTYCWFLSNQESKAIYVHITALGTVMTVNVHSYLQVHYYYLKVGLMVSLKRKKAHLMLNMKVISELHFFVKYPFLTSSYSG